MLITSDTETCVAYRTCTAILYPHAGSAKKVLPILHCMASLLTLSIIGGGCLASLSGCLLYWRTSFCFKRPYTCSVRAVHCSGGNSRVSRSLNGPTTSAFALLLRASSSPSARAHERAFCVCCVLAALASESPWASAERYVTGATRK